MQPCYQNCLWRALSCLVLLAANLRAEQHPPEVNVILWFDTEDYLLPADDDAAKRLAQMLSERNIRATFKLVGEKARVLEKRSRQDVIAALKKHDIGYHANFHSVHPTPSEYLAECALLDGMAEFIRREGGGAADVRWIFGVPTLSCYGQPGSSWAAQAVAALPEIGVAPAGVPCYLDEGTHVSLDGKPFWYAGALMVYGMSPNYTRMELHDPDAVDPAKKKFSNIAERLRADNGGLISIFYHPCEWVHREFWDSLNFRRGANPPREQWKAPPQRPPEETEAAFRRFADYIDYIRSLPGIRFVTASQLPGLYPDPVRKQGASAADLDAISERLLQPGRTGVDFMVVENKAYSAADQFELLTFAVTKLIAGEKMASPLSAPAILGPDGLPPSALTNAEISWSAFREAALDTAGYLQTQHRIPSRIFLGANAVAPADFLPGLGFVFHYWRENKSLPLSGAIPLPSGWQVLPAQHVAKDTPELFGGWIIHPAGFRAPKILEVARLQAWTLKPALRER